MQKLLIIFFVGAILWSRFFLLDQVPTALHPDEAVYTVNAQSLILSGSDLSGQWRPWKLQPLTSMHAELPALITAIGYLFTDNPVLAARIPSAIMGSLLPFIFAWIGWGLFKNKSLAWSIAFVTAFNPWILQNSRFGFDPMYSVFFYSFAIAVYINFTDARKLISIPLFFVGFYQYQGYKLLLIPIVSLLLCWQIITNKWQFKKTLLSNSGFIAMSMIVLFIFYLTQLLNSSASQRISERSLSGGNYLGDLAKSVDFERRVAIPSSLNEFFSNKITSAALERTDLILVAFSPTHLFLSGEPALSGFSVWSHGFFYLIDVILIFAGLYWLTQNKHGQQGWLILAFAAIGILPALINTTNRWFIFRPSFTYLMLAIVAGIGLYQLTKNKSRLVYFGLFCVYLISFSNFSYQYFFRYPAYSIIGNYFDHRQLAGYVNRASQHKPVTVYSPEAKSLFDSYLLYGKKLNADNISQIKDNYNQGIYKIDNINFLHKCVPNDIYQDETKTAVVDPYEEKCEADRVENERHLSIAAMTDSAEVYKIYGDSVCENYNIGNFIKAQPLKNYNLEKISNQLFCENWLSNVNILENAP